ncbi:MAG: tRNA uridine(34) 5-carboxymethylaminomethyl modification radical SAM/GNAT enzyme Elp3 [Candidatus Bathyarchaeia archaeon]
MPAAEARLKELAQPFRVFDDALTEALRRLAAEPETSDEALNKIKLEVARKYSLHHIPSNPELLSQAPETLRKKLAPKLALKKVRSLSGVQVIAVMSKPHSCPHGRCLYCPSFPGVPQSYTGYEPSSMRGIQHRFDPYTQLSSRLSQLKDAGHRPSKVEIIVQGGTFPALSHKYQEWFIRRCLDALTGKPSSSLEEAKKTAENSTVRNVGITVETRPDRCGRREVDFMLKLGVTRVELGVQALYNDVYKAVARGHTVDDVRKAFQTCKDAGLKVVAHMMIGLPQMTPERDLDSFKRLLFNADFRPDMLKIYPCLVLRHSQLYQQWRRGEYKPYDLETTINLIVEVKKLIPPWIRVMRVQRDIPAWMIVDGVKKGNLRELALERLKSKGYACRCIRCREMGHRIHKDGLRIDFNDVKFDTVRYEASGGEEAFISLVHQSTDTLMAYLRLRKPSTEAWRPEVRCGETAFIRELHVLGTALPLGERSEDSCQHRGYGNALVRKAEEIAYMDYDARTILVTSGLGVRPYYRRLGYRLTGPYMGKKLTENQY